MSTQAQGTGGQSTTSSERHRIVALVDGSHYSESVCDHAAWVSRRAGSAVQIVHLISRKSLGGEPTNLSGSIGLGARTALLSELAELDAQKARLAQHRGRAILVDAESRLTADGIPDATTRLRHGEVVETLQEIEDDADLLVMGKRGEASSADSPLLGANLESAIRATRKPLLVASRAFTTPKRVMLAFDGGKSALKAVDFLAARPHYNDLECHLLSVGAADVTRQRQLEGAATLLRDEGFTVHASHTDGQPESLITAEAQRREIDLLIMGAYGHSRIRNFIIGSTTTQVVRACRLPTLLFR